MPKKHHDRTNTKHPILIGKLSGYFPAENKQGNKEKSSELTNQERRHGRRTARPGPGPPRGMRGRGSRSRRRWSRGRRASWIHRQRRPPRPGARMRDPPRASASNRRRRQRAFFR